MPRTAKKAVTRTPGQRLRDAADTLRLWADLARCAQPGYVAPATLLALTAWQAGDGALANLAGPRAGRRSCLPDGPPAPQEALNAGAPPSMAPPPMTPGQAARRLRPEHRFP